MTQQDFLNYPIDQGVLDEKRIRLNRPSFEVLIEQEYEEGEGEGEGEGSNVESVVESVASYCSIAHNADFVGLI
jgi:hypothetical protein